jgi:dUTP pyrophosphatase
MFSADTDIFLVKNSSARLPACARSASNMPANFLSLSVRIVYMQLKVKKLDPDMPDLQYAQTHDAGFDIYAREATVLAPGEYKAIPTGLQIELPEGYVALVWDKSGLAIKNGLKTLGGVIDAGYRGEYMIGIINLGSAPYTFEKGHKVAQILIQKVECVSFDYVDELSQTDRGSSGFGASGK